MLLYTYTYDFSYNPSMPVVEIMIGRARSVPTLSLVAFVDSGADATVIPLGHLNTIQARKAGWKHISGIPGQRIRVDMYAISLRLGNYNRAYMEVAANIKNTDLLLGRDLLNHSRYAVQQDDDRRWTIDARCSPSSIVHRLRNMS